MTTTPQPLAQALRMAGVARTGSQNRMLHCGTVMNQTPLRYRCGRCGQTVEHVSAQHPGIISADDDQWVVYHFDQGDSALNASPGYLDA